MKAKNKQIVVVGAGAVGGYFGAMLQRAGTPVLLIGRSTFCRKVEDDGLTLDSISFTEVLHPAVSEDLTAGKDADILLLCVKTVDTESVMKQISPYLKVESIIVSMQNGVENVEIIRKSFQGTVIPAAVYVAVSMPEPGYIKHVGRGDLVIGPANRDTEIVRELFEEAQIPCSIVEDIDKELWTKLVWNCAANAISGLAQINYGQLTSCEDGLILIEKVVDEVLRVAAGMGIELEVDGAQIAEFLGKQMPEAMSSTYRDLHRLKKTEVDAFNGFIYRVGQSLGIACPYNESLYRLVKLKELRKA